MTVSLYNTRLEFGGEDGNRMGRTGDDPMTAPYAVDEREFPSGESPEEQFGFLLRYAILAPSTHKIGRAHV